MIKFDHVFMQYSSEFYSLYDFSCEVNSHTLFIGDFFSGTNAIMRTLSKIDADYKGEILIDGKNLKAIKDKDLRISYLPESPVLFKSKSIFKNLYYPLKIKKINKENVIKSINDLLFELQTKNLNFSDLINHESSIQLFLRKKVKELSLSEQKIVSLMRTILKNPKYVLLENFFENLNETEYPIAEHLINRLKKDSTIIACEKGNKELFKNFNITDLTK